MDGQPISMFDYEKSFFPIGIIAMDSAKEVGGLIDKHLMGWYYKAKPEAENDENTKKSLLLKASCPRFNTGDAKAVIGETVRGYDMYIITDVGNYNCEYDMYGN